LTLLISSKSKSRAAAALLSCIPLLIPALLMGII